MNQTFVCPFTGQLRGRRQPARFTINDEDRRQWILNEEGLYNWQRSSGLSLTAFVRENRTDIDRVIREVTGQ